jgi:bacterioferritin
MPAGSFTAGSTTYETCSDEDLEPMIRNNLTAERAVITAHQEILRWLGDGDPTSRRLTEDLLADEEAHADDLVDLPGA